MLGEGSAMKITTLEVQGFRSLSDVEWKPGDLNLLIGPNASGKSNVLRVLEMLSCSADGKLGDYVQREGGMLPLIWDGRADTIGIRVKTSPIGEQRNPARDSLTYELTLAHLKGTSTYRIQHELLGNFYRVEAGEMEEPFKLLEREQMRAVVFDEHERRLEAPEESFAENETLLSVAAGPFTANKTVHDYRRRIAGWNIYKDLHTNPEAPIRQAAVARPEKRVDPHGQNLIPVLHTLYSGDRDFEREVDSAMKAAFGDEFEKLIFPPAADQRIQLRVRWKSLRREQSAADLSDGTLRFLFLLAVLASPDPPSLIAVDEPETGLHPAMLPIVAEYAIQASTRTQVILATHSPSFLDAFSRDHAPTTTVVEWIAGQTKLSVRSGDELAYWLKDYTLGELYRSGQLEAVQ